MYFFAHYYIPDIKVTQFCIYIVYIYVTLLTKFIYIYYIYIYIIYITLLTLPTKVHLVKAMVFPVVMYGCESWTIKKAEC